MDQRIVDVVDLLMFGQGQWFMACKWLIDCCNVNVW